MRGSLEERRLPKRSWPGLLREASSPYHLAVSSSLCLCHACSGEPACLTFTRDSTATVPKAPKVRGTWRFMWQRGTPHLLPLGRSGMAKGLVLG